LFADDHLNKDLGRLSVQSSTCCVTITTNHKMLTALAYANFPLFPKNSLDMAGNRARNALHPTAQHPNVR
jgi:hypothetical protein